MSVRQQIAVKTLESTKFVDPQVTAKGERRASVALGGLDTLWFNSGTLCNIECAHCYIESSPTNDRLEYLAVEEVVAYLEEVERLSLTTREIGFTGGEPFLNPQMLDMIGTSLGRGFEVLVLTNAMQPMMRPAVQKGLVELRQAHGNRLALRVSVDHYTAERHDEERGAGSFAKTIEGLRWLSNGGFRVTVAGRTMWGEDEADERLGYQRLFDREGIALDGSGSDALVLFPEMDGRLDVPEITVDCWETLSVDPKSMMCASSRMVVKRQGASPTVLACTLLPYDPQFELGAALEDALGVVMLNHPHCAKFCVLGGGSCSAVAE
jgi:uncharacterized Fe-S cluster-containing radical SAM superfamily protein